MELVRHQEGWFSHLLRGRLTWNVGNASLWTLVQTDYKRKEEQASSVPAFPFPSSWSFMSQPSSVINSYHDHVLCRLMGREAIHRTLWNTSPRISDIWRQWWLTAHVTADMSGIICILRGGYVLPERHWKDKLEVADGSQAGHAQAEFGGDVGEWGQQMNKCVINSCLVIRLKWGVFIIEIYYFSWLPAVWKGSPNFMCCKLVVMTYEGWEFGKVIGTWKLCPYEWTNSLMWEYVISGVSVLKASSLWLSCSNFPYWFFEPCSDASKRPSSNAEQVPEMLLAFLFPRIMI